MFNKGLSIVYKHFLWDYKYKLALLTISFIIIFFLFYMLQAIEAFYSYYYHTKTGFVPDIAIIEKVGGANILSEDISRQVVLGSSPLHYKTGAMYELQKCRLNYGTSESQDMNLAFLAVKFPVKTKIDISQNGKKYMCLVSNIHEFGRLRIELTSCNLQDGHAQIINPEGNLPVEVIGQTIYFDATNQNTEAAQIFYRFLLRILNSNVDQKTLGIYFDRYVRTHNEMDRDSKTYDMLTYLKRPMLAYFSIIFNTQLNSEKMINSLVSSSLNEEISRYEGLTSSNIIDNSGIGYPILVQDVFQNDAEYLLPKDLILVNYEAFHLLAPHLRDKGKKFLFLYFRNQDAAEKEILSLRNNTLTGVAIISKKDMIPTFSKQYQYILLGLNLLKGLFTVVVLLIVLVLLSNFYNNYRDEIYLMKIYGLSIPYYTIFLTIVMIISGGVSILIIKYLYYVINRVMEGYYYPAMQFNVYKYYPPLVYASVILLVSLIYEVYFMRKVVTQQ